jgi:hypothetical protein
MKFKDYEFWIGVAYCLGLFLGWMAGVSMPKPEKKSANEVALLPATINETFATQTNSPTVETKKEPDVWAGVLEHHRKSIAAGRKEFNECVTNRANWKIVSNGEVFNVRFFQPSTGWMPYSLFPDSGSDQETEKTIQFYINHFIGKQLQATSVWSEVTLNK